MPVICGKSDYWKSWYQKRVKNSPEFLKRRAENQMRFYYQNRAIILHKKREQYKEKHGTVKKYNFVKPLKEYRYPERKQFRKRRGHIEPILHHYPKNRLRSWSKSEKEGIVV